MEETPVIRTESLSKRYGVLFWKKKQLSLDRLSISVPRGAVFGFLGPNGAGKTTTIKLLMDLIHPTSGTAEVLGKPVWDPAIRRRIGFLPDAPAFNGLMTASEFLNICAKLLKMSREERKRRVPEVLETVRMTASADDKLGGFSRGMLQRIGVAQAILNKPDLLILDEPLLGLDPYGRQELKRIIREQNKQGTTVFFSSHILADVQEICDHAAILNRGRLLCSGKLGDLLSSQGLSVRLTNAGDLVKDLLPEAKECQKKGADEWELTFEKTPASEKRLQELKEKHAGKVEVVEQWESLEDFFFEKIEQDNGNGAGKEATE